MLKRWRDRSKVERVEWQTRITLSLMNWVYLVAWSGTALHGALRQDGVALALGPA